MNLLECFRNYKEEMLRLWAEAVYAASPFDAKGLLRTVTDPFGNPGADMIREAAGALYGAVAGEETTVADVKAALERFVKLRAVQQGAPSQALGIFYLLKPIMRGLLLPHCTAPEDVNAYLAAESRLDSLALLAFDMYMAARETLAESRVEEIRSQHAQLTRWARENRGNPFIAG
ncbi:MAG: RsbRD N-terminal domain-containing protein [Desulfovibrio sp.]|nr:RsbRD N-terminal domain-containing protein [Desulfovibrio sp.]